MSGRQDRNRTFGPLAKVRGPVSHNEDFALHRRFRGLIRATRAADLAIRRFVRALASFSRVP